MVALRAPSPLQDGELTGQLLSGSLQILTAVSLFTLSYVMPGGHTPWHSSPPSGSSFQSPFPWSLCQDTVLSLVTLASRYRVQANPSDLGLTLFFHLVLPPLAPLSSAVVLATLQQHLRPELLIPS